MCPLTIGANSKPKFIAISPGFSQSVYAANWLFTNTSNRNSQHYIIPDREIPLKVDIRGLPRSMDQELLKETLACKDFCATKISQLKSKRDGKFLPLFLAKFPKNKSSYEIFKVKIIFNFRVDIETFWPAYKITQYYRCQKFYHVAASFHNDAKCVGRGGNDLSTDCELKQATDAPKPPSKCNNCGLQHTDNYKECNKYPIKPQYRKCYENVAKSKNPSTSKDNETTKVKDISQTTPPPPTQQFYELQ